MKDKIKKIYSEELNYPALSEQDDFYDVGGHSLIMTKIRKRFISELNLNVPIDSLFRYLTVESLYNHIK
ncbi:phosphopantetheine-binding protein [Xenorhabdus ishibashii]|uniref:Peptide synthase n=1 Tax=Xenorhabdus ishibashii TaxID=1034471 RepID=A0A2D0KHT9_9GAMM|nr:phosphopantetheine-binding protein [Xenorhabdus ishibashii]PHM62996.1 peptide synthase [Xenorhabdus ishibashii]